MGASTDQIDRQIKETRDRMDENLGLLEARAASNAKRYGRIVAIVAGIAAAGGAGFLLYRRFRRPSLKDRLRGVSPAAIRHVAGDLRARVMSAKRWVPAVTVTVNDGDGAEPGTLESIVRKVAPALAGTASTAVIERVAGTRASDEAEQRGARGVTPAVD